jgi:hypothetical protein
LYDDELELTDEELNTPTYIGYSSVQDLVASNAANARHAELLRGPLALGTMLGNAGYPSVPSEQIPFPGTNSNYFSGGYNTVTHTSYQPGNVVNGLQIECNFENVRDTPANRKAFADSLAISVLTFLEIHEDLMLANCSAIASTNAYSNPDDIHVYPTIADGSGLFKISGVEMANADIELFDITGRLLFTGKVQIQNQILIPFPLAAQTYILRLQENDRMYTAKIFGR